MSKYLVLLLAVILCFALVGAPMIAAQQKERIKGKEIGAFLVRIIEHVGPSPEEAKVKPGTTVIWVNTGGDYVEIIFTGNQVEAACMSPVHFFANPTEGGFYSDRIPPGAAASLCFVEKGTFDYKVIPAPMRLKPSPTPIGKETKGTIIVE